MRTGLHMLYEWARLPGQVFGVMVETFFRFTVTFLVAAVAGLWCGVFASSGFMMPAEGLWLFMLLPTVSVFTFWGLIIYPALVVSYALGALADEVGPRVGCVLLSFALMFVDAARLASLVD